MDALDFYMAADGDVQGNEDGVDRVLNGRVRLGEGLHCTRATPYGLFTDSGTTTSADGAMTESLRMVEIASSNVATVFFSKSNIESLQLALRHGVYKASGANKIVVSRQSDIELGIIMRAKYFACNRKGTMTVSQHVAEINRNVLAFCIPTVLNEAMMYLSYRHSIQRLPTLMDRGTLATQKGSKQIPMMRF